MGGEAARYLRLYSKGSTGNDLNHFLEVEIHGKPAKGAGAENSKQDLVPLDIRAPHSPFSCPACPAH